MKTVRTIACPALVVLMILTGAVLAQGQKMVPYRDTVNAVVTGAFPVPSTNLVRLPFTVLRGQGTHVGRFTTSGELLVDVTTLQFTGTNTLTSANGDRIFIEITGGLTPTSSPDQFIISVSTTFVGGTGRWVNATGGFDGTGDLQIGPGGMFYGSTFTGVGNGTISQPNHN